MVEKIDLDHLALHLGLDDGRLGRRIVQLGSADAASERGCQLFRRLFAAEIVQVFGGEWTVVGELFGVGILLGPEVQSLSADNERAILKLEGGGEM
ncbi:MAG: hypothetical protein LOX97_10075 [Sphingomonas sp.]|nr:hypothetical protein [Sphingomonas sp.]